MDIKEIADKIDVNAIIKQAADEAFDELKVSAVSLFKEHVLLLLYAHLYAIFFKLSYKIA